MQKQFCSPFQWGWGSSRDEEVVRSGTWSEKTTWMWPNSQSVEVWRWLGVGRIEEMLETHYRSFLKASQCGMWSSFLKSRGTEVHRAEWVAQPEFVLGSPWIQVMVWGGMDGVDLGGQGGHGIQWPPPTQGLLKLPMGQWENVSMIVILEDTGT